MTYHRQQAVCALFRQQVHHVRWHAVAVVLFRKKLHSRKRIKHRGYGSRVGAESGGHLVGSQPVVTQQSEHVVIRRCDKDATALKARRDRQYIVRRALFGHGCTSWTGSDINVAVASSYMQKPCCPRRHRLWSISWPWLRSGHTQARRSWQGSSLCRRPSSSRHSRPCRNRTKPLRPLYPWRRLDTQWPRPCSSMLLCMSLHTTCRRTRRRTAWPRTDSPPGSGRPEL